MSIEQGCRPPNRSKPAQNTNKKHAARLFVPDRNDINTLILILTPEVKEICPFLPQSVSFLLRARSSFAFGKILFLQK